MKYFSKLTIALLVTTITFFTSSCEKDEDQDQSNTILSVALENPDLSTFADVLLVTNLEEILKKQEPYTVFAPTNKAFEDFLIYSNYKSLSKVPVNLLKQLILNHIIVGNIKSTELSTGYVKTLAKSSVSGTNTMSMYVDISSGVKLNGVSKVTTPNIITSNGTIHLVDAIIDFPFITTHLKLNPKLSTLSDVITVNADADFVKLLSLPNFYKIDAQEFFVPIKSVTVFAPTNTAFSDLNTELAPSGIGGVTKENLNNILKYHVTNGNFLAASLTENQKIPSLFLLPSPIPIPTPDPGPKYEEFTIQLTGGPKIKDVKNRISTIEATDIQCWNGVIHVVNKVLLPNL